jgi:hypothetical protein
MHMIRLNKRIEHPAVLLRASIDMEMVRRNEVVEVPAFQVLAPVTVLVIRGNFLQIGSAFDIGAFHGGPPFALSLG